MMASTSKKRKQPPQVFANDSEASTSKRRNVVSENVSLSQPENPHFRCGKITRIHLHNFMCHSNLIINFSDRVNFLVGSNGSGKSAILAALVLGLGAKSSSTNRSTSMKQFIKTEESFCDIQIEIANGGPDAFNADVYGDKIIVVRHITQTTSYYRIKNHRGDIVSKKADDLHKIMLYHNIQVDNPVFVLNQDNARVFLKDLDPAKNYQLFIKATQIEMVAEKLNDCLHASKEQKFQLSCLGQKIAQSREEIDGLKQKLAELDSVERVKKLLKTCELERLWIFVREQEKKIEAVSVSIAELSQQRSELENMLQNKDTVEAEFSQAMAEMESTLEEKRTLYSRENIKHNELKTKFNELTDRSNGINDTVETLKKKQTFVQQQIQKLQEYIEQKVSSSNRVSVQELRARNDAELGELKNRREEVTAMLESTKRDAQTLIGNKGQIDQKIDDFRKNKHRLQEETRHIQSQIHNIKANTKDAFSIYGEHVSQIVSMINRFNKEGRFSELPRGPLGRYIEVVDARFRDAVENQLGGLINSFVVSNNKDYKVLESILCKYPNYNPMIITSKFMNKAYDVSKGKVHPPRGTQLLLDQIRCSDHVVLNCLIDMGSIETVLLTEHKETAENFTSHIENVPHNLRKIILIKPGSEYCPEPSYRMYSLNIRPARFIQVDIRERINQLESEMQARVQEIQHCESKLQQIGPKLQEAQKSIQHNRALSEKHEQSKRNLEERISELESFEYPDANEIDLLANELEECKRKLLQHEKEVEAKTSESAEAKIARRAMQEQITEHKASLKKIEDEMTQIKSKSDETRVKLSSLLNDLRINETKLQEIESGVEKLQEEKARKTEALSELHSQAENAGSRINSKKSEEQINEIIQKLKSKIRHRSKCTDSPEEVQLLLESKTQKLSKHEILYSSVNESLEMLNESRLKRFRFIKHLKRHMAMKVMFTFQSILSYRQFTGDISIDHDERKLTLSVVPRDHGIEGSMSSTKSLSGGERSFSTVAFLLSLWSCVDHPFYVLDEYDVFTDEVNRELMTRMLLNEAEAKPHRQYTFLTPQDMALESKDYIRIHKMADPNRRD